MAHHGSIAIAGNAEHSQRSGGLSLDALDTALDQAVEGDLLAQLELVHIGGRAAVDHLEQLVEFVGARLQHLKRFVGLNGIGHHAAIAADQTGQKAFVDARLCCLVLDLLERDGLGANIQRISHAAHNGSGIFGLIAGQVEGLIGCATGLALGDAKCLPATDSTANFIGQYLVSFWDQLEPASLGCFWRFTRQSTGSLWHQVALGFRRLLGHKAS